MKRILLVALLLSASPWASADLQVIDGDTIKYDGERMRLLRIDTPETYRPSCDQEAQSGKQATHFLQTLVNNAERIEIHPSGETDRYSRPLVELVIDGQNAGDLLLQRGLALPWEPGREAWRERKQHWCGYF